MVEKRGGVVMRQVLSLFPSNRAGSREAASSKATLSLLGVQMVW